MSSGSGGGGGGGDEEDFPLMVDVTGCKSGANKALHGTTVKVLETKGKSYVVEDAEGAQHQVQIRSTTPSPTKGKKGKSKELSAPPPPATAVAAAAAADEDVLMVQVTGCKTGKNKALHDTTVKVFDSILKSFVVEDAEGAQHRVQKRSTMPMWKAEGSNFRIEGDFDCDLLRPLVPPPAAVLFWTEDAASARNVDDPAPDCDDSDSYYDGDETRTDFAIIATMWLIAVVQSAYLSDEFKKAGRKLMACSGFMDEIGDPTLLGLFDEQLLPTLKKALAALSKKAKKINTDSRLAEIVTESNILECALFNLAWCPDGSATPRDKIRQDLLMPSMTAGVSSNYESDWKVYPEHIYIHMLLLVATALNPMFAAALKALFDTQNGVKLTLAPIKSYMRMINKLQTAEDHRKVKLKPRPAMNIDIVRILASASSPEDIIALVKTIAAEFGGLSYLKCLPELALTNPPAAAGRYHMLPVMITVVFAPEGLTVGSLLADSAVRAAWAKLRTTRPSADVSTEEWQLDHDTALNILETKCDPKEPVQMHCEVQVVTEELAEVRHGMHEVYKVVRASNARQLHADVAKPADEVNDFPTLAEALLAAAKEGRITTVKRLLKESGRTGSGGDGGSGGSGAALDVDFQSYDSDNSSGTPLYNAAQNGHLAVVLELLKCNADPNEHKDVKHGKKTITPLCIAVQNGHLEIVKVLLESKAALAVLRTPPTWTARPLEAEMVYIDHEDVMKVLVEHGVSACEQHNPGRTV